MSRAILLFAILLFNIADAFARGGCQIGQTKPPDDTTDFTEKSSNLQIFAWMRAPCDGIVRSVTFFNHAPGLRKSFYLAIFEPINPLPGSFRLIDYIEVPLNSPAKGWQTARLPANGGWKPPLRVDKTNVFGIFYEFLLKDVNETVVPFWTSLTPVGNKTFPTYTGALSFSDVQQIFELRNGIELDKEPLSRVPAFLLEISTNIDETMSCGKPPTVEHAYVADASSPDDSLPGDFAVYECVSGYAMLENMYVICQPDGIWSDRPVCAPISIMSTQSIKTSKRTTLPTTTGETLTCAEDAPEIPNGVIVSGLNEDYDLNEFGDVITYQCDPGYAFVGLTKNVTCLKTGQWSLPVPVCSAVAGATSTGTMALTTTTKAMILMRYCIEDPPEIPNGSVESGLRDNYDPSESGDVIVYKCDQGYAFVNKTDSIKCLVNGKWSYPIPVCAPVGPSSPRVKTTTISATTSEEPWQTCEDFPPEIAHAKVVSGISDDYNEIGADVTYSCDPGFQFVNQAIKSVTCQENGLWSLPHPECVPIGTPNYCLAAPQVANAEILKGIPGIVAGLSRDLSSAVGDVINYRCVPEFTFRDQNITSVKCLANGQWSSPAPVCVPVASNLTRVILTTTAKAITTGVYERICEDDPPEIPHGKILSGLRDDYSESGAIIIYICDRGFAFVNLINSVTCLDNGQWSMARPVCAAVPTSSTSPKPSSKSTTIGAVTTTTEEYWDICQDDPPIIPNAKIASGLRDDYGETGDVITYSCEPGFVFSNATKSITCLGDGQWSRPFPVCVPVPTSSTSPKPASTSTKTAAQATTTEEYGDICEDYPPVVLHATVASGLRDDYTESQVGDIIIYTCDPGFAFLNATKSVTCLANGEWSLVLPVCIPTANISSTTLRTSRRTTTRVITIPIDEFICEDDPPEISHGKILSGLRDDYSQSGDAIFYICDPGYTFVNQTIKSVTCLENGLWSLPHPECAPSATPNPIYCFNAPQVANATISKGIPGIVAGLRPDLPSAVGDVITYSCDRGFMFRDQNPTSVKCLANGQWSLPVPVCVAVPTGSTSPKPAQATTTEEYLDICEDYPPDILHATIVSGLRDDYTESVTGDIIVYKCDLGFVFANRKQQSVVCLGNGEWSSPYPQCVAAANISTTTPAVSMSTSRRLITITAPASERFCEDDPPEIRHASVVSGQRDDYNEMGDILVYRCHPGYIFATNTFSVTCLENGQWSLPYPQCVPGPSSSSKPSTAKPSTTSARGFSTVTVPITATPSEALFCEDDPPEVENARIVTGMRDDYSETGDTVTYSCNQGYVFATLTKFVTCLENGLWSSPYPKCVPVTTTVKVSTTTPNSQTPRLCIDSAPQIPNSRILSGLTSGFSKSGDVITYTCASGFTFLTAANSLTCLENGQWSFPYPLCVPAATVGTITVPTTTTTESVRVCNEKPPEIPNASIVSGLKSDVSVLESGTEITYRCDPGYDFFTARLNSITCQKNGRWSSQLPVCVKLVCQLPPPIDDSTSVELNNEKTAFTVRCSAGFMPSSRNGTAYCDPVSQGWSPTMKCLRTCGAPPQIPYAYVDYQTFMGNRSVVGSLVRYVCARGFNKYYRALGDDVICGQNSKWPDDLPRCVPKDD